MKRTRGQRASRSRWPLTSVAGGRSARFTFPGCAFLLLCLGTAGPTRAQGTASPDPPLCRFVLAVAVVDSTTGEPIDEVALRLTQISEVLDPGREVVPSAAAPSLSSRTVFSDVDGQAVTVDLCPGDYRLETIHVAYRGQTKRVRFGVEGGLQAAGMTRLRLELVPRVYAVAEVDVRAESVAPLISLERASHQIPFVSTQSFVTYDLIDAVALVPGVLVTADRPFFRGVGPEHLAVTIDGVPAREPITGEWILPPPPAVEGAELIASTMVADSPPALGGVLALRLGNGNRNQRTRIVYGSGGWSDGVAGARRTDTVTISTGGRTGLPGLSYAGSYRGIMENGPHSYDRALPAQSTFGLGNLGSRMSGDEAVSFKMFWARPREIGPAWRVTAAVVSAAARQKSYQAHYAKSGWVGYSAPADRYTEFLEEPPVPERDVFYEGPAHVPTQDSRSTLWLTTFAGDWGEQAQLGGHLFLGDHRFDTQHQGRDLDDETALEAWERESVTSTAHQEEDFFAVHGDLPSYSWSRSREGGAGLSGSRRVASQHHLRGAVSVVGGRYRYLSALPPPAWWIGSFEEALGAFDGSGYLQDTWHSDGRAWSRFALRYVFRRVTWKESATFGSRWAPAIAFHQPMTAVDALHVEVGQSYQFPALQTHFPSRLAAEEAPAVQAQRVRFAEVGIQHHFSQRAVAYVGGRQRQYIDVVFAARSPTVAEELTGTRAPPPEVLEARELEISVDLQLAAALTGQTSFVWSRTLSESTAGTTIEVPWSRRAFARSWLVWRASRALSATLTLAWDSGRPYDLCLLSRGCALPQRIKGRLPWSGRADAATTWETRLGGAGVELTLQIENLLNQRPPTFDFSSFPMGVTSDHFLAYWDETGETGGYLVDTGVARFQRAVENPQTRRPGRAVLAGIGITF